MPAPVFLGEIMNRTRAILRGSFYSGGSVLVSMAAMLAVGKIFTNALDKTDVAVFSLLLVWSDMFILSGNFGLSVSLPKLIAGAETTRRAGISGSAFVFQAGVGALIGMTLFAAWWFFPEGVSRLMGNDGALLLPYIWLLPLLFLIGALRDTALAALAGFNRYAARAAGIITASMAQAVLVFFCLWVWRGGVVTLALTFVAAYALETAWLFIALPRGARWHVDARTALQSVRFSIPLYVNSLLTFLVRRFDTVLILMILQSVEAVAVYEIAKRLATMLSRVLVSMLVPYLPSVSESIAHGNTDEAARLLRMAAAAATFFGYLGTLTVLIIQEPLIILLFNAQYLGATAVLGLLLATTCVIVHAGVMGQTLIALGKPTIVTAVNIFTAIISVGANYLLLPRMGLMGAGVAGLLALSISNIAQAYFVHRAGIRVNALHHIAPHLFMAIAGSIMFLGGGALIWRIVASLLFVVMCFASGLISPAQVRNAMAAMKK